MNKAQVSIDQGADRGRERFRAGEFKRVVALTLKFKRELITGLICTIAYACLHTASISAAFPVFKILLEEEDLTAWVDRTVAENRIGVSIAPPGDARQLLLLKVGGHSAAYQAGVRVGSMIYPRSDETAVGLLHDIAHAPDGATFDLTFRVNAQEAASPTSPLSLGMGRIETQDRLLQWASGLIPASATTDKLGTLRKILIALVVIVIAANTFRYLGEAWIAKGVLLAMMDLRSRLYERTLLLPLAYFSGKPTADVVGRFVQDIQEVQRGMLSLFARFIREPLRAVFILGLALKLDWRLTLTIICVAPVVIAIFWRVGKRVKNANRKLLVAYGSMIDALTASLQNLRVVKAYTAETYERGRLRQVDFRIFRQQLKLAKLQAMVSPLMETLAAIAASLVMVWLASQVLGRHLPVSNLATLGVTMSMLVDPMRKLTDVYVRLIRASAGAERVFQVLDEPIEVSTGSETIEGVHRGISFDKVSFTYPGAERPSLSDISLTIARGETVALVGANGSGKTTLASLLPRMFDPTIGRISIDDTDLRDLDLVSLRRAIGLVSQDAVIFAGTPVENIAYGTEFVERDRVVEASQRAYAHEFITALPGGYESDMGERGTTLSGGQRQRIAIARAIYRDAPILIFDEATSQVDSESEQKIQTALREFAKARTTIIIAHRLSTIQFANRIVVLDGGRIIDIGPHRELFGRCDVYRTLCETQFMSEPLETGAGNRPDTLPDV